MNSKLLKISEVSEMLSVTQKTLRIWDKDESSPLHSIKTNGGHRRYLEDDVLKCMGICKQIDNTDRTSAIYARVSSNEQKQKGDLDRQALRLSEYCLKNDINVDYRTTATSDLNVLGTSYTRVTPPVSISLNCLPLRATEGHISGHNQLFKEFPIDVRQLYN